MNKYIQIIRAEFFHLTRSPFKIITLLLFLFSIIYGCQNGYDLFKRQNKEIVAIKSKNKDFVDKMIIQYEAIENGTQDKPRRDPSVPYWAIWSTPSYAFKYPSPMMVFSLGQSEQYGYYKRVTNWSTTFDSDLAEEIANPERLAIGTLDFNFVFIYLTPILIIILLFNIGGLEKDLGFNKLIFLQNITKGQWLFARFLFYFIATAILFLILMLCYALISGIFPNETSNFISLFFTTVLYVLFWFCIFYFVSYHGRGSSDQAIKMISIWLVLCIIIPGVLHQLTSIKHPTNYMTDYLDVSRDQVNDIFELSSDTLRMKILEAFPSLEKTLFASDTSINKSIVNRSVSGLVNVLNKKIANEIEKSSEEKNEFIKNFFIINPVIAFQNQINALTGTDYYAYLSYRKYIQTIIDKKIELILEDTWNKVTVNKKKYTEYIENFKQ